MNLKRQKPKVLFVFFIFAIIATIWVYYFPLQKFYAKKKYLEYATQQGVTIDDIKSMEVYKDYKQGGYYITVKYYSDPDHLYDYQYFLVRNTKRGVLLNTMYCYIFDSDNNQLDDFDSVVYKPIA